MRLLHFCCLVVHGLIAGTYTHECWVAGNANLHNILVTVGYVGLAILQLAVLYVVVRKGKCDDAPVG